jgi:pimeloyl-ACP methyl ester carboxylesterase
MTNPAASCPGITLDTHVQDVASLIWHEDLTGVVLVGHSYAGMLLQSVADAVPGRIARLVYLDAFLPEAGRALSDYVPLPPLREDGWRIPPPAAPGVPPAVFFGITDPADQVWAGERLGDQPLRTFTDPVRFAAPGTLVQQRTFVQCSEDPWFEAAAGRARRLGFDCREMRGAGHNAMMTRPGVLAGLLLENPGGDGSATGPASTGP